MPATSTAVQGVPLTRVLQRYVKVGSFSFLGSFEASFYEALTTTTWDDCVVGRSIVGR